MQFVYPSLLWALLLISIPILIHLFFFRRHKKVYFSNVKLLKEIKEEKNVRNRLRNFLILLSRILAFACLVFTFAQPFLPINQLQKKGQPHVSIYLDNSKSMMLTNQESNLLEYGRLKARQIITSFPAETKIQLLTNDKTFKQRRYLDKTTALNRLSEVSFSNNFRSLSNVFDFQKNSLPKNVDNHHFFWLTDMQAINFDEAIQIDSSHKVSVLPLMAAQGKNIAIDSCWFDIPIHIPGQQNKAYIKLTNHGEQSAEKVQLGMRLGSDNRPIGTIDVPANTSVIDTVSFTLPSDGWQEMSLSIDDQPLQFDNSYQMALESKGKINVLHISDKSPNRYLNALLANNTYFDHQHMTSSNINYNSFNPFDLIILYDLNQLSSGLQTALTSYLESGGKVFLFPSVNMQTNTFNSWLQRIGSNGFSTFSKEKQEVQYVNFKEFIFQSVYNQRSRRLALPTTKGQYDLGPRKPGVFSLIRYRNGNEYLIKRQVGSGLLYTCAAPIESPYNDLTQYGEIFLPMVYRMALSSAQQLAPSFQIGKDNRIVLRKKLSNAQDVLTLRGQNSEIIPTTRNNGHQTIVDIKNQIQEPGFYDLYNGDQLLAKLGFIADRRESNIKTLAAEKWNTLKNRGWEILDQADVKALPEFIGDSYVSRSLLKYFLLAAIIFLIIETLLLKFWKNN